MTNRVLKGAKLATMPSDGGYGIIDFGALAIKDGLIDWVGTKIPDRYADWPTEDVTGRLITPALVDCHTHLVFGGNRAREFEMRLNGAGYEEIARAGGGIVSTVTETRRATPDELVSDALRRLDALISEGVSVVEIKSGYGLDQDTELRMLRAARSLAQARNVRIRTSFLGAHAVPAEYMGRADAYIDDVCLPTLRAAHAEG